MNITIRPALASDRASVAFVESKSTPSLSYVAQVFDMFLNDPGGEFSVAEVDGDVVACGKFTRLADDSAWLETIRVLPEYQGRGIGKRFYQRFFEVAAEQNITTMRMYTGVKNAVSKGLAEHFGFQLAETFHGAKKACPAVAPATSVAFQPVTDFALATETLMSQASIWKHFLVMNRTFYKLSPALCTQLVQNGQVYQEHQSGSMIVLGARFMPEAALHIGQFGGRRENVKQSTEDVAACLDFAIQHGSRAETKEISCLYPASATDIEEQLVDYGFDIGPSAFIVMERTLP